MKNQLMEYNKTTNKKTCGTLGACSLNNLRCSVNWNKKKRGWHLLNYKKTNVHSFIPQWVVGENFFGNIGDPHSTCLFNGYTLDIKSGYPLYLLDKHGYLY